MQQLDDALVLLQSMGFSPHRRPFEERLAKWEVQLRLVSGARVRGGIHVLPCCRRKVGGAAEAGAIENLQQPLRHTQPPTSSQ